MNDQYSPWSQDPTRFQTRSNLLTTNPNPINRSSKRSDLFAKNRQNDPLGISNVYKYPNPTDFYPNRSKGRTFYPKKRFNRRFAPYAPRNTTSFLIRAKKSGGITSVSPYPVTPAVLPTPMISPLREELVDTAREQWGVNDYGTMSGLIRLRVSSLGHEHDNGVDEEEEGGGGTSDSDIEERVEVERRLDHDLSRFEMVYPNDNDNVLVNRVDEQERFIGRVEEENLTLKERLYLMERELEDMRRRVLVLEMRRGRGRRYNGEEVVSENGSDNECGGDVCSGRSGGGGNGGCDEE